MKNIFQMILENRKFQKVTFSKNRKISHIFEKKLTFGNFRFSEKFRENILLEISDFSKSFEKYFHRKNKRLRKMFIFYIFISYLMYNFSAWHRETPTVPPVGAVNAPPENQTNPENSSF